MGAHDGQLITAYDSGKVDAPRLGQQLPAAWAQVLADPAARQEAAAALGVDPAALDTLAGPPLRIETGSAFSDTGSMAVLVLTWLGSEILLKSLADLAREALKARMRLLWAVIEPKLRDLFEERDALGPESALADEESGP